MKKRILVVEDDAALARVLRDNLAFDGFDVECVTDGHSALRKVRAFVPDLIVLDIMLPDTNGFDLCGVLRQGGRAPIIILSARGQKKDKLRGLDLGADDYITKPFDLEEFLARVRAVLRRARSTVEQLTLGRVAIDFRARHATKGRLTLHLTHREFELLQYLAERQERVVYRNELLREVWGYPDVPNTRSVDHAIARLRKKIESDAHHPRFIHTVHGDGYCLSPKGLPAVFPTRSESA
ncbi:MAG: response regulator transcription factor [Acidobacteria bacterium]|nr:response regulator transcription factor [Acidobacteriota bacterium]